MTDHTLKETKLRELFVPIPVAVAVARPSMYFTTSQSQEMMEVYGATDSRRQEFAAGRACARAALMELIGKAEPIFRRNDRTPIWPSGVVGSIAHCEGFCGAVLASNSVIDGLGLDAEPVEKLTSDLHHLICRQDEMNEFVHQPEPLCGWPKLIFTAKEAIYKSYFPVYRVFLDFHDVKVIPLNINYDSGNFRAEMVNTYKPGSDAIARLQGRWAISGTHVLTITWLPIDKDCSSGA